MLNLKNPLGRRVDVKVAANVTSGKFTVQNKIAGIPVSHTLNGATVTFVVEGLVALTLAADLQGTLSQGSFLYWNFGSTPTANALSLGAASKDLPVGQIVDTNGAADPYIVRLQPGCPISSVTAGSQQ